MKNIIILTGSVIFIGLCILHFYSGREITTYTTLGRIREHQYKEVEKNPDSWKVHLYSGGKEITTYTTVGRIREHQYNSTISFIDVLSGKEVVISGTFVAEEF